MKRSLTKWSVAIVVLVAAGLLARQVVRRAQEVSAQIETTGPERRPAPVEVAPIERGPIVLRRTFSGALEASSRIVVATKVGGLVERVGADLGDLVRRDEVVVWVDDDEAEQAVAQAEAELEVARANLVEAESALEIAARELTRIESLQSSGITSESQYDTAKASELARRARVLVTRAQVTRSEAALETTRIRLAYTQVAATWSGEIDTRVVAERFVDEGDTVTPNAPLLAIVALDPIIAVVFVPERDYASLSVGQPIEVTTQGVPDARFAGRIERIAPVFRESTRQARVELAIPNPDQRLKPGMFVRATIELARIAEAVIVPEAALTERGGRSGLFVLTPDGASVRWRPVTVGVREGARMQVEGEGLEGLVVTLGQELVDDGAPIVVPEARAEGQGQ